jgi:hypothetical protein
MQNLFKIYVCACLTIIAGLQLAQWVGATRQTNYENTGSDALFVDPSRVRSCEASFSTGWWMERPEQRQAKLVECIENK